MRAYSGFVPRFLSAAEQNGTEQALFVSTFLPSLVGWVGALWSTCSLPPTVLRTAIPMSQGYRNSELLGAIVGGPQTQCKTEPCHGRHHVRT